MMKRFGWSPQRAIPLVGLAICFFIFNQCSSQAPSKGHHINEIQVMTFNVENLFDTIDDPRKNDETFLPMATKRKLPLNKICAKIPVKKWRVQCQRWDWNQDVLDKKMENISQVILSVNDGKGPDILILQEVENKEVLDVLNQKYLQPAGYQKPILLEGMDARGIDVAVLSRFPAVQPAKLEYVPFSKGTSKARMRDTRGILKVKLKVDEDDSITVLANHFPAPFHPRQMRIDSFKKLNRIASKESGLVVAGGDFNLPSEEDGKFKLLNTFVAPQWTIAHRQGCKDCKGTNYYKGKDSWSFLDMILVKRGEPMGWALQSDKTQVIQHPIHIEDGHPKRFDPIHRDGVSDHWPLLIVLRKNG
ncbi:MAG: endonuclease/exonuclease/phosphatase family protein [Bdellovibrionales bacterium]|nr:endonuclease/exonuclease/phosphatase family protein [Bdellovibrionales bacterium]